MFKPGIHALILCIVPGLIALTSTATADTLTRVTELQQQVDTRQLWLDREWLNLLHYDRDSGSASGYTSQVDDDKFFQADDGKTNPRAELHASIAAFYDTTGLDDSHAQCRFIARLEWLRLQLDDTLTDLPAVACKEYQEWRARIPDQQLTMIFPAYHLNSPSSMFGHTLLRLDPANLETDSDWLSIAVNFGANVQQSDNSLFFAVKGLTGGYPGFFIVTPYFNKIKEYNRDENRDIWEYPLNLTPDEIKKMVAHLWELRDIEFDYYFFDENCSYRLLELIEVARPEVELTDDFYLTAIPVDTVRSIERANLIRSVDYRPSQATVLRQLLHQIPDEHHDIIYKLAHDTQVLNSTEFTSLSAADQRQLIDAAYKYLRYQHSGSARSDESAKNSYLLLSALNDYPPSDPVTFRTTALQPEKGHLSNRMTFGLGKLEQQNFAELGFRMSFHSLEDNEHGFLQGAQINLGSLQIRALEDDSVKLQQLDMVDIFSLTPRSQFIDPLSWRVYTGLERIYTATDDPLAAHVTGGLGVAYQTLQHNQVYMLATLRLEHNSDFSKTIEPALGYNAGMLHHFGTHTAHLQLSGEEFSNDASRHRVMYTHNIVLATNHAIKLNARKERQDGFDYSEVSLAYQYYF